MHVVETISEILVEFEEGGDSFSSTFCNTNHRNPQAGLTGMSLMDTGENARGGGELGDLRRVAVAKGGDSLPDPRRRAPVPLRQEAHRGTHLMYLYILSLCIRIYMYMYIYI